VDLAPDGPLGLITFSIVNATGDLDEIATQSFVQHVTAAQRAPVLELGRLDGVLSKTGTKALDPDAAKAIGKSCEVKSFFFGEVRISKVERQVDMTNVLSGNMAVRASFDIDVTVRLVSAETGRRFGRGPLTGKGPLAC